MSMPQNSPCKPRRFAKKPGPKGRPPEKLRLLPEEHQKFRLLVLGGERAPKGRLAAWAAALQQHLSGPERVAGDPYVWLSHRLRVRTVLDGEGDGKPLLFADAARIYRAGLRSHDPALGDPVKWADAVGTAVPALVSYAYGQGVPGRLVGDYDGPFMPVMIPPEYIPTLAEEIAEVVVERDDGGRRRRVGERIEGFLTGKIARTPAGGAPWNFSASFAVQNIALSVLFRDFYRGRFGPESDMLRDAVNESGYAIGREVERALADPNPRAFDRALTRLRKEVAEAIAARKPGPSELRETELQSEMDGSAAEGASSPIIRATTNPRKSP